jgi:hypothetical protein
MTGLLDLGAASIPWADSSAICTRRQVTADRYPVHNPHQPPTLIIVDLM